jgi:ATP-dependent helicase/nuclease subunit A
VSPVLETSFRSAPEVLAAVDATFARLNLAPGSPEGENVMRHLANRAEEHGLVEVWQIAPRPERESGEPWDAPLDVETGASAASVLAQTLAETVRGWIDGGEGVWDKGVFRPMHAGDVLVLVRKRGPLFRDLIRACKRKGLPVAGADRMVLRDELAVEDCLALMRVALDPDDDYSLACVLKGPWCNLTDDDADVFPLCFGREGSVRAQLLASTEAKYADAQAFVQALEVRGGAHAFELLSWALETRFEDGRSGWEKVFARLGAEARDPIEELLARALKPGPQHAPNLHRFVFEIESDAGQVKREMEAAGENVRVMTVHGAKGLEAPVVILPDTTGPAHGKVDDGVALDESGPYLLGAKQNDDRASRAARERYSESALGEHWRLLYVAMTRARDRLIVCGAQHGNAKTGEAEESWRRVVDEALAPVAESCETPFGAGLRIGAARKADGTRDAKSDALALPDWARTLVGDAVAPMHAAPSRLKRADPALFSPRGDGQKRFRRGRLIHGLLQRLPDIAPERRAGAASTRYGPVASSRNPT